MAVVLDGWTEAPRMIGLQAPRRGFGGLVLGMVGGLTFVVLVPVALALMVTIIGIPAGIVLLTGATYLMVGSRTFACEVCGWNIRVMGHKHNARCGRCKQVYAVRWT